MCVDMCIHMSRHMYSYSHLYRHVCRHVCRTVCRHVHRHVGQTLCVWMRVSVGSDYLADGGFGWAWRWSNVTSRPVPHPLSPSATSAWDSWLRSERDLGWDSEENATFCDALRVACAANVTVRGMFH